MHYVYILISQKDPSKHYVGLTTNLDQRLSEHNTNSTGYTKKYSPWHVETYIAFRNEKLASSFERYLKEGSGHALLKKRFLPLKFN